VTVADRVEQWMRENPGQHVFSEIARGVKLADVLVREALRDDERFRSRERGAYDADRAVVFFLPPTSADGSRRAKKPSQEVKVEAVLADGRWHTAAEIHKRCGFMRLNSRIAALRKKRGLLIECERILNVPNGPDAYRYRLIPVATSGDDTVARAQASCVPATSSGVSSRDRCEGEPGEASADHQLAMPEAA
jgi:hypothetical protein